MVCWFWAALSAAGLGGLLDMVAFDRLVGGGRREVMEGN